LVQQEIGAATSDAVLLAQTAALASAASAAAALTSETNAETAETNAETAQAAAELARDLALVPSLTTRASMETTTFPAALKGLRTFGYAAAGDGGEAMYARVAAEPAHPGKVRSLDRFLPNGSTDNTNGGWWQIANEVINTKMLGALANGSNQTAAVQAALDVIGARGANVGGIVDNDKGVHFIFDNLNAPQRVSLQFWRDDDDSPTNLTSYNTNERIFAQMNANDDGIANEWGFRAPYHPGFMVSLDNNTDISDPYLGTGQVRIPTANKPARASYNIQHSGFDIWRAAYEVHAAQTRYNGISVHAWMTVVLIVGIDAASFSSAPAVGSGMVRGTTSGAIGMVRSYGSGFMTVFWRHGFFLNGETLQEVTNIGEVGESILETTAATISSTTGSVTPCNQLWFGTTTGAISVGGGADTGQSNFGVRGRFAVSKYENVGQQAPFVDPTRVQLSIVDDDSLPVASQNGVYFEWDLNVAAASRRLFLKSRAGGQLLGSPIVAASALVSDNGSAAGVSTKSFGITVARSGVAGIYDVTFTTARFSADYTVNIQSLTTTKRIIVDGASKTALGFQYHLMGFADSTLAFAAHMADITVTRGDI
jgi:hypothetical protein